MKEAFGYEERKGDVGPTTEQPPSDYCGKREEVHPARNPSVLQMKRKKLKATSKG